MKTTPAVLICGIFLISFFIPSVSYGYEYNRDIRFYFGADDEPGEPFTATVYDPDNPENDGKEITFYNTPDYEWMSTVFEHAQNTPSGIDLHDYVMVDVKGLDVWVFLSNSEENIFQYEPRFAIRIFDCYPVDAPDLQIRQAVDLAVKNWNYFYDNQFLRIFTDTLKHQESGYFCVFEGGSRILAFEQATNEFVQKTMNSAKEFLFTYAQLTLADKAAIFNAFFTALTDKEAFDAILSNSEYNESNVAMAKVMLQNVFDAIAEEYDASTTNFEEMDNDIIEGVYDTALEFAIDQAEFSVQTIGSDRFKADLRNIAIFAVGGFIKGGAAAWGSGSLHAILHAATSQGLAAAKLATSRVVASPWAVIASCLWMVDASGYGVSAQQSLLALKLLKEMQKDKDDEYYSVENLIASFNQSDAIRKDRMVEIFNSLTKLEQISQILLQSTEPLFGFSQERKDRWKEYYEGISLFCLKKRFFWNEYIISELDVSNFYYENHPETNISIQFNQDVNSATLTKSTVKVTGSTSGELDDFTITYDATQKKLTIDPFSEEGKGFENGETVTVHLTTGIFDSQDRPLTAPFTKTFPISNSDLFLTIKALNVEQDGARVTTSPLSGFLTLKADVSSSVAVSKVSFYYSADAPDSFLFMDSDSTPDDGWTVSMDTMAENLGRAVEQKVYIRVVAEGSYGMTATKLYSIKVDNAVKAFRPDIATLNFMQVRSDPVSPEAPTVNLQYRKSAWTLLQKPDFVRVQRPGNEIQVGEEVDADDFYVTIKPDSNRGYGTYTGTIALKEKSTNLTAEVAVVYAHSSKVSLETDLELRGTPVPMNATDGGSVVHPPFRVGQRVYWHLTFANNGPQDILPAPNGLGIAIGYYINDEKYTKLPDTPPSWEMRAEKTGIGNLDSGESRVYARDITFTEDDLGKDLYFNGYADWERRVGEGTEFESNNYATYGPFRVLPALAPDFELAAGVSALTLRKGVEEKVDLFISGVDGFSSAIGLSMGSVPDGLSVNLGASSVLPDSNTGMLLQAGEAMEEGVYEVLVLGTSGDKTRTLVLPVTVVEGDAPELALDGLESYTTDQGDVIVSGTALDSGSGLASLFIDSGQINAGNATDWSFSLNLLPGPNSYTIYAVDQYGNLASRTVEIYSQLASLNIAQSETVIKNIGSGFKLNAIASNSADVQTDLSPLCTWSSSDTGVVTVAADGTLTAVSTGQAVITVEKDGLTSQVTITVDNTIRLGKSASSFAFAATEGLASPLPGTLRLWNEGGNILSWHLSEDSPWLTLDARDGTAQGQDDPDVVTLFVDSSNLSEGTYTTEIILSADNCPDSPTVLPVTLVVHAQNEYLQPLYPDYYAKSRTLEPLLVWSGIDISGDYTLKIYEGLDRETPAYEYVTGQSSHQLPEGSLASNTYYTWLVEGVHEGVTMQSAPFVFKTPLVTSYTTGSDQVPLYTQVVEASADAQIGTGAESSSSRCWPDNNYGDLGLIVGHDSVCTYKSLVDFDIARDIPMTSTIVSAAFQAKANTVWETTTGYDASQAAAPWKEMEVTWNTAPQAGLALGSVTNVSRSLMPNLDVTSHFSDWLLDPENFHGLLLESNGGFLGIDSRERSQAPALEVAYYYDMAHRDAIQGIQVGTLNNDVFSATLPETITAGVSFQFAAKINAEAPYDNTDNLFWTVLPVSGNGTIDIQGVFNGTRAGTCLIYASAYGHAAVSGLIRITPTEPVSLELGQPDAISIGINNPFILKAHGLDEFGNKVTEGITFQFDAGYSIPSSTQVTLTSDGVLTFLTDAFQGPAHITAVHQASGLEKDFTVDVAPYEISEIEIVHDPVERVPAGSSLDCTAIPRTADGLPADVFVVWGVEGDDRVARAHQNGTIDVLFPGRFKVVAASGTVQGRTREFEAYWEKPQPFALLAPASDTERFVVDQPIQWEKSEYAEEYEVLVSRQGVDGPEGTLLNQTVTATSVSFANNLKFDTWYDIEITAKGKGGATMHTGPREFRTELNRVRAIYHPSADTYVAQGSPTTIHGAENALIVKDELNIADILLKFDLSELEGKEIVSANLLLYLESGGGGDGSFTAKGYELFADWNEGDATWNTRPEKSENSVTSSSIYTVDTPTLYQFGMTGLVRGWVADPDKNYGISIGCTADYGHWAQFPSKEDGTLPKRPMLVVEFRGGLEEAEEAAGAMLSPARAANICSLYPDTPYANKVAVGGGYHETDVPETNRALLGYDLSSLPVNISGLRSYLHLGYEYNTGENENAVTSVSPYVVTKPWTSTDTWSSFGDGGHESSSPYSVSIAGPDNEDYKSYYLETTDLVSAWHSGATDNNGLILKSSHDQYTGASVVKEFAPVGFGRLEPFLAVFYDWTEPLSVEGVSMKSFQGNINPFTKITISFDRRVDPATMAGNVVLTQLVNSARITVSATLALGADGRSIAVSPASPMESDADSPYTVTVMTGLKDETGNALDSEYSHSFLVTVPPDVPYLETDQAFILFDAVPNSPTAKSMSFVLKNGRTGLADPAGSILNWQVESLPEWLSIDTSQGSLIAGQETALTLVADTTGKGHGHYNGQVVLTCGQAPNSPHVVDVLLKVSDASFAASDKSGASPNTYTFTDQSTGDVVSWVWDFGDGTTSTEQNPTHTYERDGTYYVGLTTTTSTGLTDTTYTQVHAGNEYYVEIHGEDLDATAFSANYCVVTELGTGQWRITGNASDNYYINKARVLKTLFDDKRIVNYVGNVTAMISSDKADQGKQGVSWSGSARKGSPGDWTGVMRYQVNFANTTALELWPYSNGAIYDGAPLEEFYCSTWVTPEEPSAGYDIYDKTVGAYTHNYRGADSSALTTNATDFLMLQFATQDYYRGASCSNVGYALSGPVANMTESGYWQINTGDRSDGTISFTFWDFAKDYGIPPFTAALDKPYGAAARPVDGYVIIEWADSEIADVEYVVVRTTDAHAASPDDGEIVYQGTGLYFVDESAQNGVTYYYAIFTRDGNGQLSEAAELTATPQSGTYPLLVSDLTALGMEESIKLSWKNPAYATFESVRVLRGDSAPVLNPDDPSALLIYEGDAEEFEDQGLAFDTAYTYSIFTRDSQHGFSKATVITETTRAKRIALSLFHMARESGVQDVELPAGWSMIGVPFVLHNASMAKMFADHGNLTEITTQNPVYSYNDEHFQETHTAEGMAETIDFSGNQLPAGWTLVDNGLGAIENDRFEMRMTDGSGYISKTLSLDASVRELSVTYSGYLYDIYWGGMNAVTLLTSDGHSYRAYAQLSKYNWGADTQHIRFSKDGARDFEQTLSTGSGVFTYAFKAVNGRMEFTVKDPLGETVMNLVGEYPEFTLSNVVAIQLTLNNTTGSLPVWIDDVTIQTQGGGIGQDAEFEPGLGYWVKAEGANTVQLSGRKVYSANFYLRNDRDLFSVPKAASVDIVDFYTGYMDSNSFMDSLWHYTAVGAPYDTWKSYDPTRPGIGNDLTASGPAEGYLASFEDNKPEYAPVHFLNPEAQSLTPTREVYAFVHATLDVPLDEVEIDWGDGQGWQPLPEDGKHVYDRDGEYVVQVRHDVLVETVPVSVTSSVPQAVSASVASLEDSVKAIWLDLVTDGEDCTLAIVSGPSHGSVSVYGLTMVYTPEPDFSGTDSFSYTVSDSSGVSSEETVTVQVGNVNDVPVAVAMKLYMEEDSTYSMTLKGIDADGESLTYQIVEQPASGTLSGTLPNLVYTPQANFEGTDSFRYKVNDGNEDSLPVAVELIVVAVDDPPVAASQSLATNEDTALGLVLAGTDAEGAEVTYALVDMPTHGALSGTAPNLTYTPTPDYFGSDLFTFKVNDGVLDSETATVSIAVASVNDAPLATSQSKSTSEDTPVGVTLTGVDKDGSIAAYAVTRQPGHGTLSGTPPNLTYTPAENYFGADSFQFTVNDGEANSPAATVSITVAPVNDAPVALAQSASTNEDTPLSIVLAGMDVEGASLGYLVTSQPGHGTLSGAPPNLTYTPAENYFGADSFEFTVSDGETDSPAATVSITVNSVNDAPVAVAQSVTTDEDTAVSITLSGTDADGSITAYAVTRQPSHGTLSGAPPNLTYKPAENYFGADSFEFTVSDGENDSPAATVSITVNSVNDAPVALAQSVTTDEDTAVSITLSGTDADGSIASYAVTRQPSHGTLSGAPPNLTYTPAENYFGADSFEFTVSDGENDSPAATVSITVNSVNDAPVALAQSVTTDEDTAVNITLFGTDEDGSITGYALTRQPSHGTLSGAPPNLTYTPTENYFGADSFEFTVSDGETDSPAATVSITVNSVNDAPVALAQSVTTDEDTAVSITLSGTDAEGAIASYAVTQQPSHGTLSGTPPNLTYTPEENYFGADSFLFTVSDGETDSPAATVGITVISVNDAPVAVEQSVTTDEDTAVAITLSGTDEDGSIAAFAVTQQPSHGTLSGIAPNLTYTPAKNYFGADSLRFRVSDGQENSETAEVGITVQPVNDAPNATSQVVAAQEDNAVEIILTGTDVDNDVLAFELASLPEHGTLTGTPPELTYTPEENFYGEDGFEFMANDGNLVSEKAMVRIEVSSVNDAPEADPISVEVDEDQEVSFTLGEDADGDALTWKFLVQPEHGNMTEQENPDGNSTLMFLYRPEANYHGQDYAHVELKDPEGASTSISVGITVRSVNDVPEASNMTLSVMEGGSVAMELSGRDVEDADLGFLIESAPMFGNLEGTGANRTYAPVAGFDGRDEFTYKAVDSDGAQSPAAKVAITVLPGDSDRDNISDGWELEHFGTLDEDGDGDYDNDGLSNQLEFMSGTDPDDVDTDDDGLPDGWEYEHSFNPLLADDSGEAEADQDGDGLTNMQEYLLGTDPANADTDGDGMPDGWENENGSDPLTEDAEADADGDGVSNISEYNASLQKMNLVPVIQFLLNP